MIHKSTIYIGIIIFILCSCRNFELKKRDKDDIVKEMEENLNTNEVDQPPLFSVCRGKIEKELEQCFENTITKHLYNHLIKKQIQVSQPMKDTIWIPLTITKDSQIIIEDFDLPDTVAAEIPDLIAILEAGIQTLPKIKPAHARSTFVTTKYRLPIVIHIE
ncbi:hypothetical protein M0D21_05815 [Aquimarina sp. D1M17]|uniref:hypothetical protein n=1 Tax=Aquimarina acroporae TaxID=2937283 RepID=UPI0020BFE3FA|nr:hypothetical protein [Aquimarina acroporae]MCK8521072.1 hypothetical protein [Aquimarina acroporae]